MRRPVQPCIAGPRAAPEANLRPPDTLSCQLYEQQGSRWGSARVLAQWLRNVSRARKLLQGMTACMHNP